MRRDGLDYSGEIEVPISLLSLNADPACGAGASIKPGWSGAEPQVNGPKTTQPAEWATAFVVILGCRPLPRAVVFQFAVPGVPLRSTPGFMLSPALRAGLDFFDTDFLCKAFLIHTLQCDCRQAIEP